jgi:hypothetical protein
MSRSYKKHPYCGDKNKKPRRTIANRHFRRIQSCDIIPYSLYKRFFDSYDICDYYSMLSWHDYWNDVNNSYEWHCLYQDGYAEKHPYPPNKKEEYHKWYKWYKGK